MRPLALALLIALPALARTRAVQFPNHERILWVGAHPDDESFLSPLLGPKCVEEHAQCTLLVLTRGEGGECRLPGGCGDLGRIRSEEMAAAGVLLRANVIQWSIPNVLNPEAVWPADVRQRIAEVIAAIRPDVVYTFDPNHGSTCHPEHRLAAKLTIEAAGATPVVMVESTLALTPAATNATGIDAERTWDWIVEDLETHRSQFAPEDIVPIATLPIEHRRMWIMDAAKAPQAEYTLQCE